MKRKITITNPLGVTLAIAFSYFTEENKKGPTITTAILLGGKAPAQSVKATATVKHYFKDKLSATAAQTAAIKKLNLNFGLEDQFLIALNRA